MSTDPGMLSNGRYRPVERLATGGMGEVWRAVDELLGRDVAIKILKDEYSGDPTFRTRFRAEARNTAGLSHPGIAQMYDYGEQDDLAYLVMELVPGQPLSEILARNTTLSAEVTLDIVAQAARALQAAHEAGIIHRDIKPGNLIVDPDGQVKITDFGIARAAGSATLTQTGTVLGTAQYVSPEQAEGYTLTPSTDIYSLGVVAYECLTGHTPFTGESAVAIALAQVRDLPPPLPAEIPTGVRELIERCLDKDPDRRPVTAAELSNIAFVARDSLRMGDAEAGIEPRQTAEEAGSGSALPGAAAGGGGALGDDATPESGGDGDPDTQGFWMQPTYPAAQDEATEGAGGGKRTGPRTPPYGLPPGATEADGVTPLDESPYQEIGEEEDARSGPDPRRVLVMAGALGVALVCAGALMLGFRWDALFEQATYSGGKNNSPNLYEPAPITPSGSSPGAGGYNPTSEPDYASAGTPENTPEEDSDGGADGGTGDDRDQKSQQPRRSQPEETSSSPSESPEPTPEPTKSEPGSPSPTPTAGESSDQTIQGHAS